MNLEKMTLWTVEIRTRNSHTWRALFITKPTFYCIHRALLMGIDELNRSLKNKGNDESDRDWLYTQKERVQNAVEIWKCIQNEPDIAVVWKQVRVAGVNIGSYRIRTSEVFMQGPNDD